MPVRYFATNRSMENLDVGGRAKRLDLEIRPDT
jgi:hypothetical protein